MPLRRCVYLSPGRIGRRLPLCVRLSPGRFGRSPALLRRCGGLRPGPRLRPRCVVGRLDRVARRLLHRRFHFLRLGRIGCSLCAGWLPAVECLSIPWQQAAAELAPLVHEVPVARALTLLCPHLALGLGVGADRLFAHSRRLGLAHLHRLLHAHLVHAHDLLLLHLELAHALCFLLEAIIFAGFASRQPHVGSECRMRWRHRLGVQPIGHHVRHLQQNGARCDHAEDAWPHLRGGVPALVVVEREPCVLRGSLYVEVRFLGHVAPDHRGTWALMLWRDDAVAGCGGTWVGSAENGQGLGSN